MRHHTLRFQLMHSLRAEHFLNVRTVGASSAAVLVHLLVPMISHLRGCCLRNPFMHTEYGT
jgi:hypothetical protein